MSGQNCSPVDPQTNVVKFISETPSIFMMLLPERVSSTRLVSWLNDVEMLPLRELLLKFMEDTREVSSHWMPYQVQTETGGFAVQPVLYLHDDPPHVL